MNRPARYILSAHAIIELERRAIEPRQVADVMDQPGQIVPVLGGRMAYQSLTRWPGGKMYVIRVIVDVSTAPPTVLTVYRTSKVSKYWGNEP